MKSNSELIDMNLGNLVVSVLQTGQSRSLSRSETEELIRGFVEQVANPIEQYRSEKKLSADELSLISFRR